MQIKEIFHVHTYRCGHAEDVEEETYVKRAVGLGAKSICFTDHAPFPGDLFSSRMKMNELQGYISNLSQLRQKYSDKLKVVIGLEVEYLPSFKDYYKELRNMDGIEFLILGQHHAEYAPGEYTFDRYDKSDEWKYLMDAQIEGVSTGLFDVVAHPDRAFRREKQWTDKMEQRSNVLIDIAKEYHVPLEKNMASLRFKHLFWTEFWELVPEEQVIYGCDAHRVCDLYICDKETFDSR